jgi:hypothetical protein
VFFGPVWDFNKQTALVCVDGCSFASSVSEYEALRGILDAAFSCQHVNSRLSSTQRLANLNQWKFCQRVRLAAAE